MRPIFVYGTLQDGDVLSLVLGSQHTVKAVPATLAGYGAYCQADSPYPALVVRSGSKADGHLLSDLDPEAHQRLCFFEEEFGYRLVPVEVDVAGTAMQADVFLPVKTPDVLKQIWTLENWIPEDKPLFLQMASEVMALNGQIPPGGLDSLLPGIFRRSLSRMRAEQRVNSPLIETDFNSDSVQLLRKENAYVGFFAFRKLEYNHLRFDGEQSGPVQRELFVTGDAVTVLPWDPSTDNVLLVEQIRAGAIGRDDPYPWCLEPIAGICDRNESTEATARREALEEAGLELGRVMQVSEYYTSPGALAEYTTSYIAEADLTDAGGIFGLASEQEDIRATVIPLEQALSAIDTGQIRVAQLIVSLLALHRRKQELQKLWGFTVAG